MRSFEGILARIALLPNFPHHIVPLATNQMPLGWTDHGQHSRQLFKVARLHALANLVVTTHVE